jgi:hypothetical protein
MRIRRRSAKDRGLSRSQARERLNSRSTPRLSVSCIAVQSIIRAMLPAQVGRCLSAGPGGRDRAEPGVEPLTLVPMTRHNVLTAWLLRSADTKANVVTRAP